MRYFKHLPPWAVFTSLLLVLSFVAPTDAFAGTLTAATFTTSGTGYAVTGVQNTGYNYGFTTASAATVSRVSATVPSGTNSYGNRYLATNGINYNYASTPDSVANSVTGDLDLRVKVSYPNWTVANGTSRYETLISKSSADNTYSYALYLENGGALLFRTTSDGTTYTGTYTLQNRPLMSSNTPIWLRATRTYNGSTGNSLNFYSSTDGANWTNIGTQFVGGTYPIYDNAAPVQIGSSNLGVGSQSKSKIYFASIANAVNGTTTSPSTCTSTGVVTCFNPGDATQSQAAAGSWVSSSAQAEPWTINRSGTNLPADIASDLSAGSVTGLPSGGTASYRMIDSAAVYVLPTPTAVAASIPCSVSFGGFTNTATAGSYTSVITTYDNSGTPVVVDSATTGALTFAPVTSSTSASATVDPTFTFTIANQPTACNGESNFLSGAGSTTGISLGHLGSNANVSGGQSLTVASNAGSGFAVYVRGVNSSNNLRSATYNWTDVAGTYASPAWLGSGEAFGYTYKDTTAGSTVTNPVPLYFAPLTSTNQSVMGSTSSPAGSSCVSFDAKTSATTPAGSYSAVVLYTAVPTF